MAKISNTSAYPLQTPANVSLADMVIITEDRTLETKNLLLADLLALQTGIVTFQEKTVEITAAEILSLTSTPITLVDSQGGDTYIMPLACAIKLDFGGVAYDFNAGQNFKITTASFASTGFYTQLAGVFLNSSATIVGGGPIGDNTFYGAGLGTANQPLILYGTGNTAPTQGDSPLVVTIQYTTITI